VAVTAHSHGAQALPRMGSDAAPRPLLRRPAPPRPDPAFAGVQIDDPRLAAVLPSDAALLVLHEGAIHAEGPAWQAAHGRLLFSDVPNRRLNAWYAQDGRVEVALEPTWFGNGNAVAADGGVYHCEHGRRCLSRSRPDLADAPEPVVTHYRGRRLNSPNDVAIGPDGAVWFTDPIYGIVMPGQGALAEPDLDHRSVYRFDPATGDVARMADFEQPNGLAFAPDGRTLYVSDTSRSLGEAPGHAAGRRHEIQAFTIGADGGLTDRRFFCQTDHGCPDGFVVDARGWLWTGAGDGIHVWSPARERLGFVPVRETVCNLTLGGADGRRLFIAASTRLLAIDLAG
jgi:gluconolactonase